MGKQDKNSQTINKISGEDESSSLRGEVSTHDEKHETDGKMNKLLRL